MLKTTKVLPAVAIAWLFAGLASATDDITTKRIVLKTANFEKQTIIVLSKDPTIDLPTGTDRPTEAFVFLHVYGGGGLDECVGFAPGSWEDRGTLFKYPRNARIKDDLIKFKLPNRTFSIPELTTKNPVNVIVRFGAGAPQKYCMRCTVPTRDSDGKYVATNCPVGACDPEPPAPGFGGCPPSPSGAFLDSSLPF